MEPADVREQAEVVDVTAGTEPPVEGTAGMPHATTPERARGRWRPWAWLLIPALAIGSWLVELRIERSLPPDASWAAAVEALRSELQPGDGVWVNPTWAAAPWADLEAAAVERGLPRGRFLLHASPLLAADLARFGRVFVVGRPAPELPPNAGPPGTVLEAEDLVVQRVPVLSRPVTDFRAALPDAQVERVEPGGRRTPCRWSGDRHVCDGRAWTAVREVMAEVGDTRRRCVWGYAFPDRGVLRITHRGAKLGKTLTGGVGLTLWAVRHNEGAPVDFRVLVDGEQVWQATMPRGDFSWHELDVDTSAKVGRTADVVFEIRSDHTYWRQMCYDAVALP